MWNATFRLLTASLLQAMRSPSSGAALYIMVVCCDWCISIRLLFPFTMASSGVRWFLVRRWFRYFFIEGIHATGISAPLSLFMLFGLSLVWIASSTFLVYQWLSRLICLKKNTKQLIAWIMRFTLDKWFEITFLPIFDNWVKWKYFLGIIIKRIKFKLLDQSYFFSALRSGIFRT